MPQAPAYYIGLMSGTSTDGIDGVLADFSRSNQPRTLASASLPLPPELRQTLLSLNISGPDELVRSAHASNQLVQQYAQVCAKLLEQTDLDASQVVAIGAHGQTVRHDPLAGYTLQLNAPALLAELSGIDVVADFRTRDVAAGGHGAPLVPAFHQALFSSTYPRTVLNLGGIANITILEPGQPVRGFDTGPANVLMDLWCQLKTSRPYDHKGQWAASGSVKPQLLTLLLEDPWFRLPPPKSTGRDLFNQAWLSTRLSAWHATNPHQPLADADIQATLLALTAQTVVDAVTAHASRTQELLVCGGGALNDALMTALRERLDCPVHATSHVGVPVQDVEALAFAWLAWAYVNNHPAGQPSVTGARRATILGCLHKA
ncbi:anhydro-N-acetylmuramic acid kinase [Pusillimonas sp. T2]|uniref:anhydro-N-acetylmuramic acid kinase n=1 Tax=Pusillimonas sp. T2 TaxID=1548123 RepID=UPI000B9CA652|nr:anhydro-N-acetylmuramic acid kinase [Pusillimonas sp. T2]OXR50893.1 anhydro-N-acetylmuramic acid kinase [Pusillimonas sp. T2]